ncbi:MAG: MerR family transcriptional regulator [Candidatus Velthaea sp.]
MRIGELAQQTGVTQKAIRYYESRGVLRSKRSSSGYRDFDAGALEVVRAIRAGQRMGLHLDDLREVLEHVSSGIAPCAGLRKLIARQRVDVAKQIEELITFDGYLAQLESAANSNETGTCPIISRAEQEI